VVPSPRQCHVQQPHASARSFPATRSRSGPTSASRSRGIVFESDPESFAESDPESFAESDAESDTDVDTVSRQRAVASGPGVAVPVVPDAVQPAVERRDSDVVGHLRVRRRGQPRERSLRDEPPGVGTVRPDVDPGSATTTSSLVPAGSVNRAELDVVGGAGRLGCVGPTPGSSRNGSARSTSSDGGSLSPSHSRASRRARPDWRPADPDRCRRRTVRIGPQRSASITSSTYSRSPGAGRRRRSDRSRTSPRRIPAVPPRRRPGRRRALEVPRPRLEQGRVKRGVQGRTR